MYLLAGQLKKLWVYFYDCAMLHYVIVVIT